jgi:hypothetical protein
MRRRKREKRKRFVSFLSASGNCDHKNVAVERENHKLFFFSFIKVCNQYKTIFMPMVFWWCSMIQRSSCTNQNHNYFRNGGLSSRRSFVASKGVGEFNEKFRK